MKPRLTPIGNDKCGAGSAIARLNDTRMSR